MPISDFWGNVLGYAAPGFGQAFVNRQRTNDAVDVQNKAIQQGRENEAKLLEELKGINQPLIQMGNEQLQALKQGVESGAFSQNDSMFRDYQVYVAPQYEPGGMFQYENRENLVTPEKFEYMQSSPQPISAPEATRYIVENQPQLANREPYNYGGTMQNPGQFQYQGQPGPQSFQYNQQAPQFQPAQQQPQWQNTQYGGQQFMTNYGQYQGQQQPQQRDITNQFNTQQYQQQQAPEMYKSPEAPQGNYYKPETFDIQNDPVYQRAVAEGGRAIEASAAAKGMQLSGSTLKALQENAVGLANQYGQEAYNRFSQDQARQQSAQNYQNEDEYRRYLDMQGIRGAEADRAIQQYNIDREFGAGQNKEAFLREQASKEFGRTLNNDEYQQWLATDGQKYSQWADQRDWTTTQSNANAQRDWEQYTYEKGFGRDVYSQDRSFNQQANLENYNAALAGQSQGFNQALAGNQQNAALYNQQFGNQLATQQQNYNQFTGDRAFDYGMYQDQASMDLARYGALTGQYNQMFNNQLAASQLGFNQQMDAYNTNLGQYNTNRDFAAQQAQQNVQNQLAAYGINNANFEADRAFNYGVNQDYQSQLANAFQYNVGNQQAQNALQYQYLTDAYNRQLANKQSQYGMLSNLVDLGMGATQNYSNALGGYYGTMSDLGIQQANAQAAGIGALNQQNTLLGQIGL